MTTNPSQTTPTTDRLIHADFANLTPDEQREYFGENGFLVIPGAVDAASLHSLLSDIRTKDWSARQENIWNSPAGAGLIENRKLLAALRACYGPDIRCFKAVYVRGEPQAPSPGAARRQGLHIDYCTEEHSGDFRNFYPTWANVGFYLTNLTPDHGPLWVVPGSNRCYSTAPSVSLEEWEPKAKMVLAKAGDAVMFHCTTIHAGGFNFSDRPREAIFASYRPAWTRTIGKVPPWGEEAFKNASEERKQLLAS